MVSVNLKGQGVQPRVEREPESGLLNFKNVIVGETSEETFTIKNISSFPVTFNLVSEVSGVQNLSKKAPFLLVPSTHTIPAMSEKVVKVIF